MTRHRARDRVLLALATAATLALGVAPAAHAAPAQPSHRQPAKGFSIRCDDLGKLTATSGSLDIDEPDVPSDGHGYIFFTVTLHNVTLMGADGTTYKFFGTGYDDVIRQTTEPRSPVLAESEQFQFQVLGDHGIVGRVDFTKRQGADGKDHVHDNGDCHLPKGDT